MSHIQICSRTTLGSHIPLSQLTKAINQGMYSVQVFLGSPYSFSDIHISKDDITKTRNLVDKYNLNLYSHLPYVYNLAGSVKDNKLFLDGDKEFDSKCLKRLKCLENELNTVVELGGKGCVLHIGNWKDKTKGLDKVIQSINSIKFGEKSKLLLETMTGGNKLGTTLQELKYVYDGVHDKDHVRICLDTCHLYAQGLYDLSRETDIDNLFEDFSKIFGTLDLIGLIHLNDSIHGFGSCKDRHARIGTGFIFKDLSGFKSLKHLLDKIQLYNIPTVLETVQEDYPIIQSVI